MDARIADVLKGLGFTLEDQKRKTEEFSGGWQMRIALAKLLLARPNLLLMDEPTNHLDLPARNWLEEYLERLSRLRGAGLPRPLLPGRHGEAHHRGGAQDADRLSRQLLEIRGGARRRHGAPARVPPPAEGRDREDRGLHQQVPLPGHQGPQVQSRIKLLDKVERIEIPPERKKIRFKFPDAPKPGRVVLELKGARRAYGDNVVLRHVDLLVERGDRIALVGANGAGKSTLMRLLAGVDAPNSGARLLGHNLVLDYFAQDQAAVLNPARNVYEEMSAACPQHHGAPDPHHPGRLPVLRRRHLQAGGSALREASATVWRWPRCC